MALPGYKATAVDGSGDTIGSTQVEVRRRSDNALASLFDAATSGSALTNPFNAGSNGDFEFFAAADDYIVTLGSGSSPQVFPLSLINSDYTDGRYAQLSGASFTGNVDTSGKIKVGAGADGPVNGDELVLSKVQTNVGMSILSEDTTGQSRLIFGTQTNTSAAKVQYVASSDEIILQSGGIVTLQSGGTVDRVTIDSSGNVGIATASPAEALDVTGNAAVSGRAKVGTGADGHGNADELVLSKDIGNVGMSLLCADATGIVRIYLGSQTDKLAASIRHTESNDRMFLQAKGELHFQTGGTSTTMTLNSSGDLDVTGALSKGSGSFKISHPLKPDTHHLVHSFIEGPQADNIYRGTVALVDGTATVNLDTAGRMTEGTFVALNGNVQCFTSNEQGWAAVRGSVSGNILTIEAQDATCTDAVSWLVIGERHDQHMIDTHWTDDAGRVITEPEKPPVEMGEA